MVPEGRATLPNTFATSAFGSLSENRLAAHSTKKAAHVRTIPCLLLKSLRNFQATPTMASPLSCRSARSILLRADCHLAAPAPACKLTRRLRDGVRDGVVPSDGLARGQPSQSLPIDLISIVSRRSSKGGRRHRLISTQAPTEEQKADALKYATETGGFPPLALWSMPQSRRRWSSSSRTRRSSSTLTP